MDQTGLLEMFEEFLNDTGQWWTFKDWLEEKHGLTPEDLGFEDDGLEDD